MTVDFLQLIYKRSLRFAPYDADASGRQALRDSPAYVCMHFPELGANVIHTSPSMYACLAQY